MNVLVVIPREVAQELLDACPDDEHLDESQLILKQALESALSDG